MALPELAASISDLLGPTRAERGWLGFYNAIRPPRVAPVPSIQAAALRRNISHTDARFAGNRQEDAHELLHAFKAGLPDAVSQGLFGFNVQIEKRCTAHNHVENTVKSSHEWVLRFPPKRRGRRGTTISLLDTMAAEQLPEAVQAHCAYDGCTCDSAALTRTFSSHPQALVIHVARFESYRGRSAKRLESIDADLTLQPPAGPMYRLSGHHLAQFNSTPSPSPPTPAPSPPCPSAVADNDAAGPAFTASFHCASRRKCQ